MKSLLNQSRCPARIQLHIPDFSLREQRGYTLPAWLTSLRCVSVVRGVDYGPATKLLSALQREAANQTLLIVDDDRIYRKKLIGVVERLADQHPDVAFGFSAWNVPEDLVDRPTTLLNDLLQRDPVPLKSFRQPRARQVDILQGLSGYVVQPRFFDFAEISNYSQAPEAAFYVDDVWISAHCKAPRYLFPAPSSNFPPGFGAFHLKRTSLGLVNRGGGDPMRRNNTIMIRHLHKHWLFNRQSDTT